MKKFYIYKKYMANTFIPLLWDEYLLEFDTEEAALDFIAVAQKELDFDFTNVVVENIARSSCAKVMNATNYRIRAGINGAKDYLYDIREGS